jgi:hypothetical protein
MASNTLMIFLLYSSPGMDSSHKKLLFYVR